MMLYEINAVLMDLLNNVDEETGELKCDPAALDKLMMDRQEALEGVALAIKNLRAESELIKNEEISLSERRKKKEAHADRLKAFLGDMLAGEKLETARVAVSFRKSKAVELDEETFRACVPSDSVFWRQKEPEINKQEITRALKSGEAVPGAILVERQSVVIK